MGESQTRGLPVIGVPSPEFLITTSLSPHVSHWIKGLRQACLVFVVLRGVYSNRAQWLLQLTVSKENAPGKTEKITAGG